MKDWELYERDVFSKLRREFGDCTFTKNAKVVGQHSRVRRQVDILIQGTLAGRAITAVVDCKCFRSNVDVKDVEAFLGFMDDVRAHVGIMITNRGYSEAARNRASVRDVKLDVVTLEELEGYRLEWVECDVCVPGPEEAPRLVTFTAPYLAEVGDEAVVLDLGRCDWCYSIHFRCQGCGEVTGAHSSQHGRPLSCSGECGLIVLVGQSSEGSDWSEFFHVLSLNGDGDGVRIGDA